MAGSRKTRKAKHADAWGYHLIINAGRCDPVALRSKETIAQFSKKLVKDIDMIAFGPPRIVRFGYGEQKSYTLVQLIYTSCISAHFAEDSNDIYLDIFSCKPFDPKIAEQVFREFFMPTTVDKIFMKRQARH